MSTLVAVEQVDKAFSLSGGGEYIALAGINLDINEGEFVLLYRSLGLRQIDSSEYGSRVRTGDRGSGVAERRKDDRAWPRSHGGISKLFAAALANRARKHCPGGGLR